MTFPSLLSVFSSESRIQGGGAERDAASAPGGGPGFWELHEQRTTRERLWVQSVQPQQDRWHQVQHRQVQFIVQFFCSSWAFFTEREFDMWQLEFELRLGPSRSIRFGLGSFHQILLAFFGFPQNCRSGSGSVLAWTETTQVHVASGKCQLWKRAICKFSYFFYTENGLTLTVCICRNITLLHYMITVLQKKYPKVAAFSEELLNVPEAAKVK